MLRNSSLINFSPLSQEVEGWREKILLSLSRKRDILHKSITTYPEYFTIPLHVTVAFIPVCRVSPLQLSGTQYVPEENALQLVSLPSQALHLQ